jgi:hypothetical protein
MIIDYSRDGEKFDWDLLQKNGFILHENDFRKRTIRDNNTGEPTGEYETVFNFVGFLVNSTNDVLSVFPKNYDVKNINEDSNKVFNVISKHAQRRPDLYLGNEYGEKFKSNYPFASFFGIYDYYKGFGLHFEDTKYIKPNIGGKVSWKETIRLSDKFLSSSNQISIFPIYYEKKYYYSSLLTECMVFVINYTIGKFGFFIEFEKIDRAYSESFFFNDKELIIEYLYLLRQKTFKDNLLTLIDHLVNFFSELNEGGSYYLKHYVFSSIWEDMVMDYLKIHFKDIENNMIVFGDARIEEVKFLKPSFRPNLANESHFFSPDYYYAKDDLQLIFDAKYYSQIHGINYKQIAYCIFLNEYRDDLSKPIKYSTTHASLILPGKRRESKIHFRMDPKFSLTNKKLVISEEYLNISEIMDFYISKDSTSVNHTGYTEEMSLTQETTKQISDDITSIKTLKEDEISFLSNIDISENTKMDITELKLLSKLEKISSQVLEKFTEEDILNHEACKSIKNFLLSHKDVLEVECYRFVISAASIIFYSSKYLQIDSFDYSLQASGLWKAIEVELNASLIYLIRYKMSICTADKYYEKQENCLSSQCIITSRIPRIHKVWLTNTRNEEDKLDNILLGSFPFLLNNILDDTNDSGAMKTIYVNFSGSEDYSLNDYIFAFKSFTEVIVNIRNPYVHKDPMNIQIFKGFIERVFNDDPEQFDFNNLIQFKQKVKEFIKDQDRS